MEKLEPEILYYYLVILVYTFFYSFGVLSLVVIKFIETHIYEYIVDKNILLIIYIHAYCGAVRFHPLS